MGWILLAVCGAGAARAVWILLSAYERMGAARDELDDSLRTHAPDERPPHRPPDQDPGARGPLPPI